MPELLVEQDDAAVDAELTKILYSNGRRSNLVSIVAVCIVLVVSWGQFSPVFSVSWAVVTLSVLIYRLSLIKQYYQKEPDNVKSRAYEITYLVTVFTIAVCWSVIVARGVWLPSFEYRIFFTLFIVSIFGASVPALASSITAIYLYVVPPFLVTLPLLIFQGGYDGAIGVALILYVYMVLKSGQNVNGALRSSITLRLHTEELNERLEDIVSERTTALQLSRDRAEEASRTKSIFLAKMSHEIRTPMNAILNFTDLALREEMSPKVEGYLRQVKSSGKGLLGIINDVLDFSKAESGKVDIEQIPFSFRELFSGLDEMLRIQAESKGLRLSFTIHENVKEQYVGDPLRVKQVLANLIENGIKFTDHGEIEISIEEETAAGNISVKIVVSDPGIGIPGEAIESLFEPFQQVDNSTTRKYGGAGLGLVICKQFVELMGGSIEVSSRAGKGSDFTVKIPVEEFSEILDDNRTDNTNSIDSTLEELVKDYAGSKVLVVDDTETNRLIVEHILHNVGIETVSASDGREAIEILHEGKIDLVLMDVQMPGMDGYQATREIRQKTEWETLPIVAMTANILPEDVNGCYEAGMNHCILKPIDVQEIYQTLIDWIPSYSKR